MDHSASVKETGSPSGAGVRFNARGIVVKPGRRQIFTRADLFAIDPEGNRKLVAMGEVLLMKVE